MEENNRYIPEKGKMPAHDPFNPEKRKNRITIRERKFLYLLSTTGNLQEAFRGVYKVKHHDDKRIESAHVGAQANQVLKRLRYKAPELVAAFCFEDISPDFVKKEMLKLYSADSTATHEKIRLLELMGKTQALFTEKHVTDIRMTDIIKRVYKETDADMPDDHRDDRVDRVEADEKLTRP